MQTKDEKEENWQPKMYVGLARFYLSIMECSPSGNHPFSTRHVKLEIGTLDEDERGRELRKIE